MMAGESYWTYKAPMPAPFPPPDSRMPVDAWNSLSPGMRREIWRDYERRRINGSLTIATNGR